jgi:hypothetical protein
MNALDLYAGASGATRGRTLKTTLGLIRRRIGAEWVGARAMTCSFLGPKTGLSIAAYADSTLRRRPRKPSGPDHSPGGGVRHRPLASRAHRLRSPDHDRAVFAVLRKLAATASETRESQRRAQTAKGRCPSVEAGPNRRGPGSRDEVQSRRSHRRLGEDDQRFTNDLHLSPASLARRRPGRIRRGSLAAGRGVGAERASAEMDQAAKWVGEGSLGSPHSLSEGRQAFARAGRSRDAEMAAIGRPKTAGRHDHVRFIIAKAARPLAP